MVDRLLNADEARRRLGVLWGPFPNCWGLVLVRSKQLLCADGHPLLLLLLAACGFGSMEELLLDAGE